VVASVQVCGPDSAFRQCIFQANGLNLGATGLDCIGEVVVSRVGRRYHGGQAGRHLCARLELFRGALAVPAQAVTPCRTPGLLQDGFYVYGESLHPQAGGAIVQPVGKGKQTWEAVGYSLENGVTLHSAQGICEIDVCDCRVRLCCQGCVQGVSKTFGASGDA
jgi:hypothetical protein